MERLEAVIKSGWKTFLEVGAALTQVRDQKLYRDKYGTFENYCLGELGFSRPYAYNLMGSAEVSKQLSSIEDIARKPLNEAQLRELIPVPEEKKSGRVEERDQVGERSASDRKNRPPGRREV